MILSWKSNSPQHEQIRNTKTSFDLMFSQGQNV